MDLSDITRFIGCMVLSAMLLAIPDTFDEFANVYGFKDKDEVYTNGSELIPVFRVEQWLEHIFSVTPQEPQESEG